MTPQQVNIMLETIGVPVAYYQFKESTGQQPPFVCFFYGNSNDVIADNSNYVKVERLFVELYTDEKNPELEEELEAVLDQHGIFYNKTEVWIESEKLYEVLYSFETEV